jgi:hypothetical protein
LNIRYACSERPSLRRPIKELFSRLNDKNRNALANWFHSRERDKTRLRLLHEPSSISLDNPRVQCERSASNEASDGKAKDYCEGSVRCGMSLLPRLAAYRRRHSPTGSAPRPTAPSQEHRIACKLYAADHAGRYPESLQQLVPSYIPDAQLIAFPSRDGSRQLEYDYFGGTETDPPDAVLIRIPPEQPGGSAVIVHADISGAIEPISSAR